MTDKNLEQSEIKGQEGIRSPMFRPNNSAYDRLDSKETVLDPNYQSQLIKPENMNFSLSYNRFKSKSQPRKARQEQIDSKSYSG